MCQGCVEATSGWDAIMDYLVATELPKMLRRPLDMDVIMGGKPSKGTPADRRLKANQGKPPTTPKKN